MKSFNHLFVDLSKYGIWKVLTVILSFLLLPYLTKNFSVLNYALLEIHLVMKSLFSMLYLFGIPGAIQRYYNDYEIDGKLDELQANSLFLLMRYFCYFIFPSILAYYAVFYLQNNQVRLEVLLLFIVVSILSAINSIFLVNLQMKRSIHLYNILLFLKPLVYSVLVYIFVEWFSPHIIYIAFSFLIPELILLVINYLFIWRKLDYKRNYVTQNRLVQYSIPLLPSIFLVWFDKQFCKLFLGMFLSMEKVAIVSVALKLSLAGEFLSQIFKAAWNPIFFKEAAISEERGIQFARKSYNYLVFLYPVFYFIIYIIMEYYLRNFLPTSYQGSGKLFALFFMGYYGYLLFPVVNIGIKLREKSRYISRAMFFGTIVNLLLVILSYWLGFIFIGIAFVISKFIVVFFFINYSEKLLGIKVFNLYTLLCCVALMGLFYYYIVWK